MIYAKNVMMNIIAKVVILNNLEKEINLQDNVYVREAIYS